MKTKIIFSLCLSLAICSASVAETSKSTEDVIRIASVDGKIQGQVFTMLENEKTPLMGNVSLTDSEGNTVSTFTTDLTGNFSFSDVEPGRYKAVGVSGDYVGDTEIEVTLPSDDVDTDSEGFYTAIPLAVAQAPIGDAFDSYGALPMDSFSGAPAPVFGAAAGGCSTCGSTCGGGYGGGGGGGLGGGGFNFRRFALIGAAVAIPVALSGGNDDMATPAED